MPLLLHTAANGHAMLEFGTRGTPLWSAVADHLTQALGFVRSGDEVCGIGEGLAPSFTRGRVVIAAGWDEWAGDYLLAQSPQGDQVLQALLRQFGAAGA